MKKGLIIAIVIVGIILAGYIYLVKKNEIDSIWKVDELKIEAIEPLKIEKTRVEYGFNTINRKSDEELFTRRERYKLLFEGEIKDSMETNYGENDFLVTYDDEFYLAFRQFKTWNRYKHVYNFTISQPDSTPVLRVDIEGENEMHFEKKMIPIRLAKYYVMNTPVDSAGIIYDFLKIAKPNITDENEEKTRKEEEELIKKMSKIF